MEMTEDITIPPEAIEAAAKAAHDKWRHDCAAQEKEPVENWLEWHELEDFEQEDWRRQARAACLAMLRNWPGMINAKPINVSTEIAVPPAIILPVPKEGK